MSALSLNAVRSVGAEEERRLAEAREHRRDPPALQPAVDHQAGEEEARPAAAASARPAW